MDPVAIERPLRQLRRQLKAVQRAPAPDNVHKLRTAARRLQALAVIGPALPRHLLRSVEAIRKLAGKLRDLEVMRDYALQLAPQSSQDSLPHLLRRIDKLRNRAAAQLHKTLQRHGDRLRRDLADYAHTLPAAFPPAGASASPPAPASSQILQLRRSIARLLRELARWPDLDESNLHDLRIRLKSLRTLVQLLPDPDPARLQLFNEVIAGIGVWHDWQLLAALAHKFLHPARDAALLARIDIAAASLLDRAIRTAHPLRRKPPARTLPLGRKTAPARQHRAA